MHILIVDDSDAFRASLRGLLDRVELSGGARPDGILEARSGEEALDILSRATGEDVNVGLVLLDLIMPGLGGLETLRRLKADPRLRDIPTIMITISSDEESLARAFAAGALDYVKKPVHMAELAVPLSRGMRAQTRDRRAQGQERDCGAEKSSPPPSWSLPATHRRLRSGRDIRLFSPGMDRIFG
jgi:CheY-like chemotaxis protein